MQRIDREAQPRERFGQIWMATYEHFRDEPERARFLTQLEESPYYAQAHERVMELRDPLLEEAARPDVGELLVALPTEVVYSLSLGNAVRLAASGIALRDGELATLVESSWRAITI